MKKYKCFVVNVFIYLYILMYISLTFYNNIGNIYILHINLTNISNSLTVFSCFNDKRYNVIRLLGISSKIVNFSCSFYSNNRKYRCDYNYKLFKRDSSGNHFNKSYINIVIHLPNNRSIPERMNIDNKYYEIVNHSERVKQNVLCITTFKNFASYQLLLDSLKIYSSYGVTDVYVYSSDSHIDYKKFASLKNIHIHFVLIHNEYNLNKSFYFGQIVKHNDCLYRNMYNSNYIIFTDYDEVIVLNKQKSFSELFNGIGLGDIYYFKSATCPTSNMTENKHFHILNDVNLRKSLNCCLIKSYHHKKYIITKPFKFMKINIHYIDYTYEKIKEVFVKEDFAHIHHSRIPTYNLMNHCSVWFYDNTLIKRVNDIVFHTNQL